MYIHFLKKENKLDSLKNYNLKIKSYHFHIHLNKECIYAKYPQNCTFHELLRKNMHFFTLYKATERKMITKDNFSKERS